MPSTSQGPNYPSNADDDSGNGGSLFWSVLGGSSALNASDDSYGFAGSLNMNTTDWIKATGYGFTIPAGATIDGILVEVEKHDNDSTGTIRDADVYLVSAGTVQTGGDDKADGIAGWPNSDAFSTYGGSADLWNLSWSASSVNNSGFGVALSALDDGGNNGFAYVDTIRITVYYTGATSLSFTQQPTNTVAGATISPAVTVTADDASFNGSVTIAIGTNPAGGTLSGTLTQTAVAGVATFNDLSIDNAGTGYTLTASATGLTGATSSTFNITAQVAISADAYQTQPRAPRKRPTAISI